MKNLFIVANWKENKTDKETLDFLNQFKEKYQPRQDATVIICPPYISVKTLADYIQANTLQIETGLQNISALPEGPHTGEVSAREGAEFAKYAIIGHSERRALGETDEDVAKKVKEALANNIEPIVCVINENVPVPDGVKIVAYEPIEAIGTGHPDTPENAQRIAAAIQEKNRNVSYVLYGGSVNGDNIRGFIQKDEICGVLVGGASLDPAAFASIIKNA